LISLIVFQNGHISGALAELIRSTRAPTKDFAMATHSEDVEVKFGASIEGPTAIM
jgi:hypothetical protein